PTAVNAGVRAVRESIGNRINEAQAGFRSTRANTRAAWEAWKAGGAHQSPALPGIRSNVFGIPPEPPQVTIMSSLNGDTDDADLDPHAIISSLYQELKQIFPALPDNFSSPDSFADSALPDMDGHFGLDAARMTREDWVDMAKNIHA